MPSRLYRTPGSSWNKKEEERREEPGSRNWGLSNGWMDGGLSNKKKRKKKRRWQVLLFFISSFSLACSTDALFRN